MYGAGTEPSFYWTPYLGAGHENLLGRNGGVKLCELGGGKAEVLVYSTLVEEYHGHEGVSYEER